MAQLRGESGAPSASPASPAPWEDEEAEPAQAPSSGYAPAPASFAEAAALLERARDLALKSDLERFARPVSFKPGRIVFQPVEGAPPQLAQRLAKKLQELTGQAWAVGADERAGGGETLSERAARLAAEARADALATPPALAMKEFFPGAELVAVRPRPKAQILKADFTGPGDDDNE